ncbi:MAG: nucleotidyltransferase domain-containing protein [Defluviitaleaceae bacterium]|nr:nucleotidyltransferase domain-containing protein [Defluviitaleaceae bacterium]
MVTDFETINKLVESYAMDVNELFSVDKVVLFGSHAKGEATAQSDIDVCFFLNSFGDMRRVDIIKALLGLMRNYERIHFEPIVFPTAEIQNDNPFVKEILRTGKEVNFKCDTTI